MVDVGKVKPGRNVVERRKETVVVVEREANLF